MSDFPEFSPTDHRLMDDEEVREAYKAQLREIAMLKQHLAAMPPAMTWTTQKPTIPGWYWYRIADHERTFILYVDVMGGATACGVLRDCMRDVGEWAGPLEPPQ